MPDGPEELLTTAAAARHFGISRRTLTRWGSNGTLKPTLVLPSGVFRWTIADIRRQMEELREKGETPGE